MFNLKNKIKGVIENRIGKNRQFTIKWSNGEHYIQNAYNIFVSINRKYEPFKHPDSFSQQESVTKEFKDQKDSTSSSINKTVTFKKE